MNEDNVDGPSETKYGCDDEILISLLSGRNDDRVLCIEYFSKSTHDACERASNAHGRRQYELGFDVAEDISRKPAGYVVRGPDESVDEVHKVGEDGPGDEIASSHIAVFRMPHQRWYVKDKGNEGQGRVSDRCWAQAVGCRVHDRYAGSRTDYGMMLNGSIEVWCELEAAGGCCELMRRSVQSNCDVVPDFAVR